MINYIRALLIMLKAHKGQRDKGGKPYFTHPLRVSRKTKDKRAKIVALLHDVMEDSDKYTWADLDFLDQEQIAALKVLTHQKDLPYFEYINAVKENPLARQVKLSDLADNMNLKRLKTITDKDLERVEKYKEAQRILKAQ